jgi:hypothetical protein
MSNDRTRGLFFVEKEIIETEHPALHCLGVTWHGAQVATSR